MIAVNVYTWDFQQSDFQDSFVNKKCIWNMYIKQMWLLFDTVLNMVENDGNPSNRHGISSHFSFRVSRQSNINYSLSISPYLTIPWRLRDQLTPLTDKHSKLLSLCWLSLNHLYTKIDQIHLTFCNFFFQSLAILLSFWYCGSMWEYRITISKLISEYITCAMYCASLPSNPHPTIQENYATQDSSGMCHLMLQCHLPEWREHRDRQCQIKAYTMLATINCIYMMSFFPGSF